MSRNEKKEKKSRIDEYNKILEQYIENNNKVDLKDIYQNKEIINKSINFNNFRTEYKSNDLNSSNLNSSAIFRTQNKSNASFLANINQSNDKSFNGNLDTSPCKKNIKTYKLTDLLNNRFVIPAIDIEDKQKNEKFPVIEDLMDTNNKHKSNNLSPLKTNEFTFDKTFGKNSEISQKLLITKETNKVKYVNTKERNISPIDDNRKNRKSPNRQCDTSFMNSKYKEKIIISEQPITYECNFTNTSKHKYHHKSSSKLEENKEYKGEKNNINKSFSKLPNDLLNEAKKTNNPVNQSVELRTSVKKNLITSMKDKSVIQQHKDTSKSREHSHSNLLHDKQPSPMTKSDVSNVSNKNSVFNSVNSGNYTHTKNSTNDSKSIFGVKVNDPESIEEMHYLYNRLYLKAKKMMSNQENNNYEKNKIFMYQTVVEIEEVDIE